MAQLQLTEQEAQQLVEALRMVEIRWIDSGRAHDPLLAIRDRIVNLTHSTRDCIVCGTAFDATNPRKTTCSDRCRQVLSRSKRSKVQPQQSQSNRDDADLKARLSGISSTRIAQPTNPPIQTHRKEWAACKVRARADGLVSRSLYPTPQFQLPVSSRFICEEFSFRDAFPACAPKSQEDEGYRDYHFAIHIPTGTVWAESINVPDSAVDYAKEQINELTAADEYKGVKPNAAEPKQQTAAD